MCDLRSKTLRLRSTVPACLTYSTQGTVSCILLWRRRPLCSPACSCGPSLEPECLFRTTVVALVSLVENVTGPLGWGARGWGGRSRISSVLLELWAAMRPTCTSISPGFPLRPSAHCTSLTAPTADAAQSAQFASYVASLGYSLIGVEEYGQVRLRLKHARMPKAQSCARAVVNPTHVHFCPAQQPVVVVLHVPLAICCRC